MKRDDIMLGSLASSLSLGELSEREAELGDLPANDQARREFHEDWLYFHLRCARAALGEMERMTQWDGHYAAKYGERQHALAQASKHYLRLIDMGATLPALLAEMVLAEGSLTP